MTFSFFKRHRTLFLVLMALGVIAFVFFAYWHQMELRLEQWRGSPTARRVVGTIGGKDVRARDLSTFYFRLRAAGQASRAMYSLLLSMAPSDQARQVAFAITVGRTSWPIVARDLTNEEFSAAPMISWYALYLEAERQGFVPSDEQVAGRFQNIVSLGVSPQVLNAIVRDVARGDQVEFSNAVRVDMTLRAYLDWLIGTISGVVEPELRERFAKMDERIMIRMVVLRADDYRSQVPEPTPEALAKQFEACKEFLPGAGPNGCGYRIPDRVAIEYLVADPAAFTKQAEDAVTDKAVEDYYESHKDPEFLIESTAGKEKAPAEEKSSAPKGPSGDAGTPGAAAPATGQPAAVEPAPAAEPAAAPPPPPKQFKPLAEVRDEIRKTLLQQETRRMARAMMNAHIMEIRGIRTPENLRIWATPGKARYVSVDQLMTERDISRLEGIGQATDGQRMVAQVAVSVPELVGPKSRIALMAISDAFVDPDGQAYAFRVTRCDKNHVPASINEVKSQVVADVREAAAMDLVRQRGEQLREKAAEGGLEKAAQAAKLKVTTTDWFPEERINPYYYMIGGSRTVSPTLPEIGANRAFVREVFQMTLDGRQRTLVTLLEERAVVVAELAGRKGPRKAAYDLWQPILVQEISQEIGSAAADEVLAPAAVRTRFNVTVNAEAAKGADE